jgi:hypothetical protein
MRLLKEKKKRMEEIVQDSKRVLSAKKESEKKYKQEIGRPNRDVLPKIEKILQRHRIEKPYYHGGLYNGKAMNKLMTSSRKIMEDIRGMLMEIASEARCNDEEVSDTMEKFTNILSVFDGLFSIARTPSGLMNGDKVATLQNLNNLALRLWRGLDLSITPKVHAIEDILYLRLFVLMESVILGRILWRDHIKMEFVSIQDQEIAKKELMKQINTAGGNTNGCILP